MAPPTEVAASIPISNTGKIRLELKGNPGPTVLIPIKGSVIMIPGIYEVNVPFFPPVTIANINYDITGIKIVPTSNSVRDARFAVYVNVLDQ